MFLYFFNFAIYDIFLLNYSKAEYIKEVKLEGDTEDKEPPKKTLLTKKLAKYKEPASPVSF